MPHFEISHDIPKTVVKGDTAFYFVFQGIDAALQRAKKAAHNKYVVVGGGSDMARQFSMSMIQHQIADPPRDVLHMGPP